MRVVNNVTMVVLSVVLAFLMASNAYSQQTKNDAITSFNKGVEAMQAENYEQALTDFNEAIKIAKEVGEEADDVLINVESQLPGLYYKMGMALYSEKKIDPAIAKFKETIEVAEKYNSPEVAGKASNAISQLYYFKGATSYKNNNFQEALDFFKQAIEYDPENVKAHYMIAGTYKALDDDESFYKAAKEAASVAKANNDNKYYESTMKLAADYFLLKANDAKKAEKYDNAVKYLNYGLEFEPDNATSYFLLAQIYNAQSKWDLAIESAKKALEYEKDDPDVKAKDYYELGNALKNKGETGAACDAYKNAAVGQYKESSEYIMKNELKCE